MTRAWIVAALLTLSACTQVSIPSPNDNAGLTALSSGTFYNVVHNGSGTATLYQRTDGSRFVRLQNFSVDAGPDLFVYTSDVLMPTSSEIGGEVFDLGRLSAQRSDYDLPSGATLEEIKSIVIWCKAFQVNFVSASLRSTQ
jgi:Electron transfer DM13